MDPVLHVLSVVHVHAYSRQINKETTVCIFFIFLVLLFFFASSFRVRRSNRRESKKI